MSRVTPFAMCLLLVACVASGVKVTEEQASQFRPGESTYQDVVAALGKPTTVTVLANGNRIAAYSYVHSQARPAAFIPVVGPLVGGADSTSNSVVFTFDRNNILVGHSSSETNIGTGTNLTSGPAQPGSPSQPQALQ
jgi:outer membrane protein assembly factor BamE (lipoprotein component of BamABCDE complex)